MPPKTIQTIIRDLSEHLLSEPDYTAILLTDSDNVDSDFIAGSPDAERVPQLLISALATFLNRNDDMPKELAVISLMTFIDLPISDEFVERGREAMMKLIDLNETNNEKVQ